MIFLCFIFEENCLKMNKFNGVYRVCWFPQLALDSVTVNCVIYKAKYLQIFSRVVVVQRSSTLWFNLACLDFVAQGRGFETRRSRKHLYWKKCFHLRKPRVLNATSIFGMGGPWFEFGHLLVSFFQRSSWYFTPANMGERWRKCLLQRLPVCDQYRVWSHHLG